MAQSVSKSNSVSLLIFSTQALKVPPAPLHSTTSGLYLQGSPRPPTMRLSVFPSAPHDWCPISCVPRPVLTGQARLRGGFVKGVWSSQVMWHPWLARVCAGTSPSLSCWHPPPAVHRQEQGCEFKYHCGTFNNSKVTVVELQNTVVHNYSLAKLGGVVSPN